MLVMDCTLRDGANVVGNGFDAHLTKMMIDGMIGAGITTIEMGNCLGLGAYEANNSIAPCTDEEYLELIQPYLDQAGVEVIEVQKKVAEVEDEIKQTKKTIAHFKEELHKLEEMK